MSEMSSRGLGMHRANAGPPRPAPDPSQPPPQPLQLWGGVECSVVRVGDAWRDQVRETGHHARGVQDLDLLASLGLRTLRYPVLWERTTPGQPGRCGWHWHDRQLGALRRHGIEVIAVTSGETADPLHTIPAALRTMMLRLFLFYILALGVVVTMVPWTVTGAHLVKESPFVTVFRDSGIRQAAGIMNFVVLTAVAFRYRMRFPAHFQRSFAQRNTPCRSETANRYIHDVDPIPNFPICFHSRY